jgi:hypothetical protein
MTPCSTLKINRRFGGTYRLYPHLHSLGLSSAFTPIRYSAYSSTLKMEAICSSEMSVDFQRTTRRYIREGRTLHNHRCENHKSYKHRDCTKNAVLVRKLGGAKVKSSACISRVFLCVAQMACQTSRNKNHSSLVYTAPSMGSRMKPL